MKISNYRVKWEIDVDAESPESAALQALKIMQDPNQTGLCFDVINTAGRILVCDECRLVKRKTQIDLEEHAVCADCFHVFKVEEDNDFATIPDLNERIIPGGMVPVCECPKCGSLAYPANEMVQEMDIG